MRLLVRYLHRNQHARRVWAHHLPASLPAEHGQFVAESVLSIVDDVIEMLFCMALLGLTAVWMTLVANRNPWGPAVILMACFCLGMAMSRSPPGSRESRRQRAVAMMAGAMVVTRFYMLAEFFAKRVDGLEERVAGLQKRLEALEGNATGVVRGYEDGECGFRVLLRG